MSFDSTGSHSRSLRIKEAIELSFRDGLPSAAMALSGFFIFVGFTIWLTSNGMPGDRLESFTSLAVVGSLLCLTAIIWTYHDSLTTSQLHALAAMLAVGPIAKGYVYLFVHSDIRHAYVFYLVCFVAAVVGLETIWYLAVTALVLFLWSATIAESGVPIAEWRSGIFVMAGSIFSGALVRRCRIQSLVRLDELQQRSEERRRNHEVAETGFREVMDCATEMIAEIDFGGKILYLNPACFTQLGYRPDELIGQSAATLLARNSHFGDVSPKREGCENSAEFQRIVAQHRDGSIRVMDVSWFPINRSSGEPAIVSISRDVTRQVEQALALEESHDALAKSVIETSQALSDSRAALQRSSHLAALGTLAAGIAHQINNPIGSILMASEGALQLAESDEGREMWWRDALENSVSQSKRCGEIVSGMLQFARNEPVEKRLEDLSVLVRGVCVQARSYAAENGVTVLTDSIGSSLPIMASPIALEQALINIVRNSIESGDQSVCVDVETKRIGSNAVVIVSDDGLGMDTEDIVRALEPFFSRRLDAGGTGLGLSVAQGIVADHGGELLIASEPGAGTTVTISIPIVVADNRPFQH